jgi:hypothetical protein
VPIIKIERAGDSGWKVCQLAGASVPPKIHDRSSQDESKKSVKKRKYINTEQNQRYGC